MGIDAYRAGLQSSLMSGHFAWELGAAGILDEMHQVPLLLTPPSPHEVTIRVDAILADDSDFLLFRGKDPFRRPRPWRPGTAVAGVVEYCDPQGHVRVGQPVVALLSGGGFATQARVTARHCLPWPTSISAAQVVALAGHYLRAYLAVAMLAQVESGQRVLVHDGTSPLGIALIQCAIARGATVISTVEDESGVDFVVRLGVDHPINRRQQDWAEAVRAVTQGRGAASIFDLLGGDTAKRSLRCIAQGGHLLLMGFASQVVPTLSGALLVASGARVQAFCHPMGVSSQTLQNAWEQLLRWYAHHPHAVLVAPERRLADAPSVLVQLAERRPYGARVMRAQ